MSISIELIKKLREETGAGVLEAKQTLEETNGDFDQAYDILREKGLAEAAKRSDREAAEGLVELYAHPGNRVGVMLEINCETDFVAMNERFKALAHDLALHIAAMEPKYVEPEDVPQELISVKSKEFKDAAASEGKPDNIVQKIIEGKLKKYYSEICLMEQSFVKDDEILVRDLINDAKSRLGENIIVRRFCRYGLGEEV